MNVRTRKNKFNHEKIVIAAVLTVFFLIPYLTINRIPAADGLPSLSTTLDRAIPFIPAFIIIYLSVFVFVYVPLLIIHNDRYFKRTALAYGIVMITAYTVFLVFPTELVRPVISGHDIFSMLTARFYTVDLASNNNFPSLHVALATLASLASFGYAKKYRWTLVWAAAIIISTLFVKQHELADIVAGMALGAIAYLAVVHRK